MVKSNLNPNDSDGELDTELMIFFSSLTDKSYPIMEIGVYKGDSAKFLLEQAINQNRRLILVDNFEFIKDNLEKQKFYEEMVTDRLHLADNDLSSVEMIITNSENLDWCGKRSSYIHIDGGPDYEDLENFFNVSPYRSIAVLDDYIYTPHKIEQSIIRIQSGYMYPICLGQKKIWVCRDKGFHKEIMNIDLNQFDYWLYLKEKYRYQFRKNFFGNKIHKFYSVASKEYHKEMSEYGSNL